MSFHGSGIADISCHGLEISVLDSTNTPGKTMKKSKIRPKPLSSLIDVNLIFYEVRTDWQTNLSL